MLCFIARRRDFVMPTAEETLLPSLELTWDSGAVREPAMAGRAPRARLLFGVADLRAPAPIALNLDSLSLALKLN